MDHSVRADWGITDSVDVALILAYADITSTLVSDADGSPINVQSTSGVQTIDYYTAELRFSGRAMDAVDWTVGGFYYDGESVNNQIVSIPFLSFILDGRGFDDPSSPSSTPTTGTIARTSRSSRTRAPSRTSWHSRRGVRYSSDEKDVSFDNTRVQNPHVVVDGDNTDYKIGLDYQFTPDMLAYASFATGYRPGSYNPRPFQATQVVAVDAEDSEAYELDSSRTGSTGGCGPTWPCSTQTGRRASPRWAAPSAFCRTWGRRPCISRMIRTRRDP